MIIQDTINFDKICNLSVFLLDWKVDQMSIMIFDEKNGGKYQPSGAGGTRSPPATPYRLQHLTARFIQNGRQGPEIGQTLCYWTLRSTFAK